MPTALLFKLAAARQGRLEWLVCAEECVAFHTHPDQGAERWFLIGRQSWFEEQRMADIEAVRQSDEFQWSPLSRRRRRWRSRRQGSTGE